MSSIRKMIGAKRGTLEMRRADERRFWDEMRMIQKGSFGSDTANHAGSYRDPRSMRKVSFEELSDNVQDQSNRVLTMGSYPGGLSPEKMNPVRNLRGKGKGIGGLWASTYTPYTKDYDSQWADFVIWNMPPSRSVLEGWTYKLNPDSNIYQVKNPRDYARMMDEFPREERAKSILGTSGGNTYWERYLSPDYEDMARSGIDGVHFIDWYDIQNHGDFSYIDPFDPNEYSQTGPHQYVLNDSYRIYPVLDAEQYHLFKPRAIDWESMQEYKPTMLGSERRDYYDNDDD